MCSTLLIYESCLHIYIFEHFSTRKIGVERVNQEKRLVEFAGYITLTGTISEECDVVFGNRYFINQNPLLSFPTALCYIQPKWDRVQCHTIVWNIPGPANILWLAGSVCTTDTYSLPTTNLTTIMPAVHVSVNIDIIINNP